MLVVALFLSSLKGPEPIFIYVFFFFLVFPGNDLPDRRRASRGLLRQQSPGTVRRHGRVSGSVTGPVAKPLEASGPAAERIQRLR